MKFGGRGHPALLLIVAVLLMAYAAWDFAEAHQLERALRRTPEAVLPDAARSTEIGRPVHDTAAGAYYSAAAALVGLDDEASDTDVLRRVRVAMHRGEWPPELVAQVGRLVDRKRAALELADAAGALQFEHFGDGTAYPYRTARLEWLSRLCSVRTMLFALAGDGRKAIHWLSINARLQRTFQRRSPSPSFVPDAAAQLMFILALEQVSEEDLLTAATSLRDLDTDGGLDAVIADEHAATIWQAYSVEAGLGSPTGGLFAAWPSTIAPRPWRARQLRRRLAFLSEAAEAARLPWPKRLDTLAELAVAVPTDIASTALHAERVLRSAQDLATLRCAYVAIAVERYRVRYKRLPDSLRDLVPAFLAETPRDPFSGNPLLFKRESLGYSVYSVWLNRRDDQGAFQGSEGLRLEMLRSARDFGIRIAKPAGVRVDRQTLSPAHTAR